MQIKNIAVCFIFNLFYYYYFFVMGQFKFHNNGDRQTRATMEMCEIYLGKDCFLFDLLLFLFVFLLFGSLA